MPARPATTDDLDQLEHRLLDAMAGMKSELRGEMTGMQTELRGEMAGMKTELRGEMAGMKTELRGEMAEMRAELIQHIADASLHTANVVVEKMREELARHTAAHAEEIRSLVRVIDDRYRDLPGEVATLRRDVEARCPPASDKG